MRALDHFVKEVRSADSFNPEVQVAPDCSLWSGARPSMGGRHARSSD